MSEPGAGAAVVCGFWDEETRDAGLAWRLGGAAGGLLARGGEVSDAVAEIEEAPGGGASIRLEAGGVTCEAAFSPRGAESVLNGDEPASGPSFAVCDASVGFGGAKPERTLRCVGHLSRWNEEVTGEVALLRHLAIPAPEGALLVLQARRAAGPADHASEITSAWLIDGQGRSSAFPEALLSTQYDGGGQQVRAGLELWPADEDAPAMRAAATLIGSASRADGVSAALMRSSAEGTRGLGSYLIWRAP